MYDKIYKAIINLDNTVMLDNFLPLSNDENPFYIEQRIVKDHPELFYFNKYSGSSSGDATHETLDLYYTDTKETLLPMIKKFNSKVNEIISSTISNDMTPLEKELVIHDYLVLTTTKDDTNDSGSKYSNTIYGIIMENNGSDYGYVDAFKLLLNRVGIDAVVVTSITDHYSWNMVTIDGQKYHADVYLDDVYTGSRNHIDYNYFNVSDGTIKNRAARYTWNTSFYPPCTSTKYEYITNMRNVYRAGHTFYYNDSTYSSLNKINIDGSNKKVLLSYAAFDPIYYNNWIYYSSEYGKIYRIRPDGSSEECLNSINSYDLYIQDGKIYYTSGNTGEKTYLNIPDYNILDLNGDAKVDMLDLATMASKYNKIKPSFYYEASNDLNLDGIIDIYDIAKLSKAIA